MSEWIQRHDVIFLCEIATSVSISVPGFYVIQGKTVTCNRGGVAILVKNYLYEYIHGVDLTMNDQIWFSISFLPDVIFGGCYIPPSDSIYYDVHAFSNIISKYSDNSTKQFCIFGDFNSRLGQQISDLSDIYGVSYLPIDPLVRPNSNGSVLLPILTQCGLCVVNNLVYNGKYFKSDLTYREGKRWISELDLFLVSKNTIDYVAEISVDQCYSFPSDHAPVSIRLDTSGLNRVSPAALLTRASQLGDHAVLHPTGANPGHGHEHQLRRRRPIYPNNIDPVIFQNRLENIDPVDCFNENYTNEKTIDVFCEQLYVAASDSSLQTLPNDLITPEGGATNPTHTSSRQRWQRIIRSHDDKALWKAIDWKGGFGENSRECPSADDFKIHLENITNPDNEFELDPNDYVTNTSVPILDNPIQPQEIEYVLRKQINVNKGSGIDGVPPIVFKYLPVPWVLMLTLILNNVMVIGYPACWVYSRLKMLYKSGPRTMCTNYRGISIIDCISKVYDYVLYNRLVQWFVPDREQAGAQPKRGCIEHIVTLRLIVDYCFRRKKKLFIAYIDFSKAYDRVPRSKMLDTLKRLGCGFVMLFAIATMYKVTRSILGTAIITATIGVWQGSPTSCFLFILFVNTLIRMIKDRSRNDGFLQWLHVLMLMDDTVILATSRDSLISKLRILCEFCRTHGMVINDKKTKFMVINGSDEDRTKMSMEGLTIDHCDVYVYLGAVFTSDGSTKSAIEEHYKMKQSHFHKLVIFLQTNVDMPFSAKRKVVDACFNAAILYGCESWIGVSCQVIDKLYIGAIKSLLGVRKTTANDLCLLELGVPPLQALVKQRQHDFFTKMVNERSSVYHDPFFFAYELTRDLNPVTYRSINNVLSVGNHIVIAIDVLKARVLRTGRTKFVTYREINPLLISHDVYSKQHNDSFIDEMYRVSFTRLRLSSHNLRVETGRWSRQPRERRLCQCGQVQDEKHVIEQCPLTERFRFFHPTVVKFPDILVNAKSQRAFKLIHDVLNAY